MCLIIHKPAGVAIPSDLIKAAVRFNDDGWGAMGFTAGGRLITTRVARTRAAEIEAFAAGYLAEELVLHLRYRTRGAANARNVQPFEVVPGLYLMHHGELDLPRRLAEHSDSWHLVNDLLRPLVQRHPDLTLDRNFLRLFEQAVGPSNRVALLHEQSGRIDLLNAAEGVTYQGLWLSGTRWIDQELLEIPGAPQSQRRSYHATGLRFA